MFAYDRSAILSGEIWRLWTGHWVHFSNRQSLLDVSLLFLVGMLAEREFGARLTASVLWLGMPVISLGLLLVAPDLLEYRGASGLAVLLAWFAASAVWHRQARLRMGLAALGFVWIVKTMIDAAGWVSDVVSLPVHVRVAWQAHVLGAVIGWAWACFLLNRQAIRRPSAFR
jgi:rhomboid family GlyGly-CTERM serine protease